ncbi:hypothetical protein XENOCAPTIV_010929 [Xenoophorus captivus]|uniref:Uncharacterized protein n=1 Tax=Xenoophorus captivus TaxID=1517983 RepID=A0ABV0RTT1_9TELE
MENSGRPCRAKQRAWERGATAADKEESWKMQDQVRGHNSTSEGGQQGKKGGLGPLGYLPVGFRSGQSPAKTDDLRWFSGPVNSDFSQEDIWRGHSQQQSWRRRAQGENPNEDGAYSRREDTDDIAHKPVFLAALCCKADFMRLFAKTAVQTLSARDVFCLFGLSCTFLFFVRLSCGAGKAVRFWMLGLFAAGVYVQKDSIM